jgi:proteasome lid subunit RPN8/RPN11
MIRWQDVTPDLRELNMEDSLQTLTFIDVLNVLAVHQRGHALLVSSAAREAAIHHTSKHTTEVGGLLVGQVARGISTASMSEHFIITVNHAVPSVLYTGTGVSLRMEAGVWSAAEKFLADGSLIVGWYHSHPNLGAFFSDTDRQTQASFFNHAYSCGWVIDPVRKEEKWFRGPSSEPFSDYQKLEFLEVSEPQS